MDTIQIIEQITDMFLEKLYDNYGEDGFESDSIYFNGTNASDGMIIQLWLEWFCGTVYISKALKAEFSTLIFPYGKINVDNKPVVEQCINVFNQNSTNAHFILTQSENGSINAYMEDVYADLGDDVHASVETLVRYIENISISARSYYESILKTL